MTPSRRYVASVLVVVLLAALAVAGLAAGLRPRLGLDLRGGLSVVLEASGEVTEDRLEKTVEIIRQRVNDLGAAEPDIASSGGENIIVQLPDIEDRQRALEIIGRTAQLRFRPVLDTLPASAAEETGWELTSGEGAPDEEVTFASADGEEWYQLGPAAVQGDQVADAFSQFDQVQGGWSVTLDLTGEGAADFEEITAQLAPQPGQQGRALAIVLDGTVESAPLVRDAIPGGQAQITGQFSEGEARDLALVLRTGALPLTLEPLQIQNVSPTLGEASLRSGLIAGVIGLALVALYMIGFYRWLGVITIFGLGLFGAIVLGVIGVLGATRGFTLTLAGIAGLIVSVGIAADSYIIYFERVKEELRGGKTFRSGAERGFHSAFRTNLAGNAVAFAAALVLWLLAIGPVRGFALTLGLSVVIDVGMLYFYTHPLVTLFARRLGKDAPLGGVGMREVVTETS